MNVSLDSAYDYGRLRCEIEDLKGHLSAKDEQIAKLKAENAIANSKIVELMKKLAPPIQQQLAPKTMNRWNAADCNEQLSVCGPSHLVVKRIKNGEGFLAEKPVSVRAELPCTVQDLFYYEVTILGLSFTDNRQKIRVGLAPKELPLKFERILPLNFGTSCFYANNGRLFVGGRFKDIERRNEAFFRPGDVVGFGINLTTRQLIFTKNGHRLCSRNPEDMINPEDINPEDTSPLNLYPCVSLSSIGDVVQANFGQHPFRYALANPMN